MCENLIKLVDPKQINNIVLYPKGFDTFFKVPFDEKIKTGVSNYTHQADILLYLVMSFFSN